MEMVDNAFLAYIRNSPRKPKENRGKLHQRQPMMSFVLISADIKTCVIAVLLTFCPCVRL